jgi:hypothetical protein
MEKTHLQHLICATVINLVRTLAWIDGKPLARTRTSKFAALALERSFNGQGKPEGRAASGSTLDPNAALMALDECPTQIET